MGELREGDDQRDHADYLVVVHHRKVGEVGVGHQAPRICERRIRADRVRARPVPTDEPIVVPDATTDTDGAAEVRS